MRQDMHDNSITADQVGQAAMLMDKGDFDLFRDAYNAWYGKEATEAAIDRYFDRYLLAGVVPFWVRHYVRSFLSDPALQKRLAKRRRISLICYLAPLAAEYALLMYYLIWL